MTAASPDVVVIGDALLDVTARPTTPARAGEDVPAEVSIACGGQGANLAVRLARRGASVELVCALGDDPGGSLVRDALGREGVALSAVPTDATGTVVIVLDQEGERTMLSQRAPFAAAAAPAAGDAVGWMVVSGYLLLEAEAGDLATALAESPTRRVLVGCAVPGVMADEWMRAAAAFRPDLVVLNRDEARTLLPGPPAFDELPSRLGERLRSGVVVTDPGGAAAVLNGLSATVRARRGRSVTDSTGAGDAFAAAMVDALRRVPWSPSQPALETALRAATELATAVAHSPGAQGRVAGEREGTLRQ